MFEVFRNTPEQSAHQGLAHSKLVGDMLLRVPFGTQFSHGIGHFVSDFRVKHAPSFSVHVGHIFSLRPQKQMFWIYTFAVVAFVKNVLASNFANKVFICKPVGSDAFTGILEFPIAASRLACLPLMASGFHVLYLC